MLTFPTKALWPILLQMSASRTLVSLWMVAKYTAVVVPESKVERTHLKLKTLNLILIMKL